MASDCFVNTDDIDGLFSVNSGQDTAAINENRRSIEPGDRHHAAGHVFVASADGDEAIHAFSCHDGFDAIGNYFPGNQAVAHAFGAHADPIGNSDGAEIYSFATGIIGSPSRMGSELVNVHVARRQVASGRGDRDLWLGEVFIGKSDRSQHGPSPGTVVSVYDQR